MGVESRMGESHLVVAPSWIGDTAMAAPFFSSLRRAYPQARIVAAARPWTYGLLRAFPWVDGVLPLGEGKWRAFSALGKALRGERVHCAWILPNGFRAALLARWSGAKRRVGYATGGRGRLLSHPVAPPPGIPHLVDYYLGLLDAQGHETQAEVEDFSIAPAARAFAENLLGERAGDAPLVGVHPGAFFGASKTWPPEYFGELIRRLVEGEGARVFILDGAAERALAERLDALSGGCAINLAGKDTLETLPAVLSCLDVFISGDTGPLHVAVLTGTATIALFGPTDYRRTAPRGAHARTIWRNLDCSPCFKRTCPLGAS